MDDKLIQIFAEESHEIIETLEQGLLNLEDGEDLELINAVFRAAHTMKGNAGIVGFDDVVALTHNMEGILHEMRKERMKPNAEVVGLLLSAVDALKVMVDSQLAGQIMEAPAEIMSALERLLEQEAKQTPPPQPASPVQAPPAPAGPKAEAGGEAKHFKISMRLARDILTTGNDPLLLLLELGEIGKISRTVCHADDLPPYSELTVDQLYLWWEIYLETAEDPSVLDNVFIFVADEGDIKIEEIADKAQAQADKPEAQPRPAPSAAATKPQPKPAAPPARPAPATPAPAPPQPKPTPEPAPAPPPPKPAAQAQVAPKRKPAEKPMVQAKSGPPRKPIPTSSTIRVDTDKLDKLVNLVGELVIGVARINQLSGDQASDELDGAVESLDHISRDLQEQVMRVRMIPVEGTFNRFQRVVRDLASELGKKIKLQMSGIETELDKNVIEQITDPLKHLIRNSADHGLETPEERIQAGKPETGTIWLKAYQQEGKIIIEVEDDGRGIDHNKVFAKAIERGLVEQNAQLSPQQAYSYMFQPGFSTAQQVTEVSGRGVGLDVVRQNIEQLRGSVEVFSELGEGSTFRIKLPLTLAIIDGMTVRIGDEVLTLPLLSIVESIRPKVDEIKSTDSTDEMIEVRGEYLPLVRLHKLFGFPTERTDPSKALVVIIESVSKRFCVLVDDILGEQQAVIKSLEQNYQEVEGIAGATILGDGRVSLILDIHGLEKMAFA